MAVALAVPLNSRKKLRSDQRMQVLAFDTSNPDIQLALMKDGQIVREMKHVPQDSNRQEAASKLIVCIDQIVKDAAWKKGEIDLIVVGIGPGSFTGVRVSVITARSLGQALKIGVFPVSVLEIVANASQRRPVSVIAPAGAGQYFGAAFAENMHAEQLVESFCAAAGEVKSRLAAVPNLILSAQVDSALFLANGNTLLPYPEIPNLATSSALLAWERMQVKSQKMEREALSKAYPWDNVLPLYLRSPSITLKAGHGSSSQAPGRC